MARDLTAAMVTEVTAAKLEPILLMEAQFDSGTVRFWTGVGQLTWDGKTWEGSGDVIRISPVEESVEGRAEGAQFQLSLSTSLLSIALSEPYQGRPVKVWLGALQSEAVVGDPYLLIDMLMDTMQVDVGRDEIDITLQAENRYARLNERKEQHYNEQEQKNRYSADTFFDYQAALQDREIVLE